MAEQEKAASCEERQINDGKPTLKGLAIDVAYGSEAGYSIPSAMGNNGQPRDSINRCC